MIQAITAKCEGVVHYPLIGNVASLFLLTKSVIQYVAQFFKLSDAAVTGQDLLRHFINIVPFFNLFTQRFDKAKTETIIEKSITDPKGTTVLVTRTNAQQTVSASKARKLVSFAPLPQSTGDE